MTLFSQNLMESKVAVQSKTFAPVMTIFMDNNVNNPSSRITPEYDDATGALFFHDSYPSKCLSGSIRIEPCMETFWIYPEGSTRIRICIRCKEFGNLEHHCGFFRYYGFDNLKWTRESVLTWPTVKYHKIVHVRGAMCTYGPALTFYKSWPSLILENEECADEESINYFDTHHQLVNQGTETCMYSMNELFSFIDSPATTDDTSAPTDDKSDTESMTY